MERMIGFYFILLSRDHETFSVQGQIVNIVNGYESHMVCVAATQLFESSHRQCVNKEQGSVPIK